MLRSLVIRDLAVISALELPLEAGLTVITGETGAGKSILLDGLTLVTGARAEASQVRGGAERAEVEAEFQIDSASEAARWLAEQELEGEEAAVCLVRRSVRADSGSRAWINGRGVTLSQTRELGATLIEIHGQHEHQRLLDRAHQLDLLDRFGGHGGTCEALAHVAAQLRTLAARRRELETQAGQSGALLELARTQLEELLAAKPTRERLTQIEAEQRRLSHADNLQRGMAHAAERLGAGDEAQSALRQVRQVQHDLERLTAVDPRLVDLVARLESVRLELEDMAGWLEAEAADLDLDPASLRKVEDELSRFHDLARRHRIPLGQLPDKVEELKARVGELTGLDAELEGLTAAEESTRQRWTVLAAQLTRSRRQAATALSRQVEKLLAGLGMAGARLVADLTPRGADEFAASGAETVEWLVSANPGQPPRPLRKVASGGELSRISLGIKLATIATADTPVLVFDEVDAGIGGATAASVGRALRALGARRQVLVVTHSPQVAAAGHQHLKVGKSVQRGHTQSTVQVLDHAARIEELARMLGGETLSAQSRDNARALLEEAAQA